jgi:hypothetical protein
LDEEEECTSKPELLQKAKQRMRMKVYYPLERGGKNGLPEFSRLLRVGRIQGCRVHHVGHLASCRTNFRHQISYSEKRKVENKE